MKLTPFVEVDGLPFSTTREQLSGRNSVGLNEMDYGDCVFRFQDCGRLEEITRRAPVVHFGEVAVPFASLEPFIVEHDPAAFERGGFRVSPKYGIAFVPQSPDWVTALASHCIETWRAL
jgi:hypothetical protein